MASGMRAEAVAFAAKHLKKNPDMEMSELKALGNKEKINIYPLIIGLAKSALGITKKKPSASKRRGPGRPPSSGTGKKRGRPAKARGRPAANSSGSGMLADVVTHMREMERELADLRAALAKIGEIAAR